MIPNLPAHVLGNLPRMPIPSANSGVLGTASAQARDQTHGWKRWNRNQTETSTTECCIDCLNRC